MYIFFPLQSALKTLVSKTSKLSAQPSIWYAVKISYFNKCILCRMRTDKADLLAFPTTRQHRRGPEINKIKASTEDDNYKLYLDHLIKMSLTF